MAKTKISEYDSTAANNTDVDGINIAESCPPSGINNAIREVMAHLKDFQSGVSGDKLPIASGGTNAGTASDARTNLGLGALAVKTTVATADIDADAINGTKIADNSIDSEHYVDGSIDTVHIADDAITSAKIGTNAVDATALNVSGNGTSGQALLSDGDGSFSWGDSGITTTTGSAPYYAARAWVVFNSGGTILNQGNVSGVSKTSTGRYTITFNTAMPDANYAICGTALNKTTAGTTIIAGNTVPSAGSMTIEIRNTSSGVLVDVDLLSIVVFR